MNILLKCRSRNALYAEMQDLSAASFQKHLVGEWKLIWDDWPGSDNLNPIPGAWQSNARHGFNLLRGLWEKGNNVFLAGGDTLCVKPVDILPSQQMRMFWETCASYKAPRPYLNADVMYFPATMKAETWAIGEEGFAKLGSDWDNSQQVWNEMFWSQDPVPELDPSLNYSPYVASPLDPSEAKIWHFHASKSPYTTMLTMREMSYLLCGGKKPDPARTLPRSFGESVPIRRRVIYDDGTGNPRELESA